MITIQGQLLEMLKFVALALGEDLRERLVFIGGCTTALFITDPITIEDVRSTDDVDLIVDLEGFTDWVKLQEELRKRGFTEAADETVICRMRLGALKVDFMPDDPTILGFSNQWYSHGMKTAQRYVLSEEVDIQILTPPLFLATKLEAFAGRGENDLFSSKDIEDILLIVDGREELLKEIQDAAPQVRLFIKERIKQLMQHRDFDGFLDGNLVKQSGRADIVHARFLKISQLPNSDDHAH